MTTGQCIKAARKRAGMTQKELGERLGVAYQTLAQWENDLRNPKRETLQRIAAALGTTVSNLLPPDNYWEDEDGIGHTELQVPTIEVHDEPIQAPKVVVHEDPPEELEALLAKLQDGEPLVLSPDELAKLKGTPKKQVSDALKRMEHKGVVVEVKSPLYGLRSMPQSGRVARFNRKFSTNTPQLRITAALDQLNEEGQEKAAERVEELTEIPRYRAQDAPQDTPPAPGGADTTPAETPPEDRITAITMVCPICGQSLHGDTTTGKAYCAFCKRSFQLP